MRHLAVVSLLVALVAVVSAASRQTPTPQEISAEEKAAIQQTWSKLDELQLAADWDGMITLYTDEAVELFAGGGTITGNYDIRGRWYNMNLFEFFTVDSEILDITGYGNTASVWIKRTMTYKTRPDAEPINPKRIHLVVMKKVAGVWKIAVVTWTFGEE